MGIYIDWNIFRSRNRIWCIIIYK